ncbi:MAG: hypothetical protein QM636_03450 [Rhizobium sp.]
MTYISETMRSQLARPHPIYHSVIKLALLTILLLGTSAVALYFAQRIFSEAPAGAPLDRPVWLLLIVAGAGLLFFCVRALPKWLTIGAPALIISQDGLTFRGKPLMRWQEITENEWVSLGGFGITTGAALHVHTPDRKIKREAITFNCSAREYMRLCELYQHGGGQQNEDAPVGRNGFGRP